MRKMIIGLVVLVSLVCAKELTQEEIKELDKKCQNGDNKVCYNVGRDYIFGENGLSKDYQKAKFYFEKGCSAAQSKASGVLSNFLLKWRADEGSLAACADLGAMYYDDRYGVKHDYQKALELFTLACDGGYAEACRGVGDSYYNGNGVSEDLAKAAEYYKKACDGGNARACFDIGTMYDDGEGVSKSSAKAAEYYKKGCDGGYAMACNNIGVMYDEGEGVSEDPDKAVEYLKKACDGGKWVGCRNLVSYYLERNKGKAMGYGKKICELGEKDPDVQNNPEEKEEWRTACKAYKTLEGLNNFQ